MIQQKQTTVTPILEKIGFNKSVQTTLMQLFFDKISLLMSVIATMTNAILIYPEQSNHLKIIRINMSHLSSKEFTPANIAVLTVSDTRNESTDTSGGYLVEALKAAGHQLTDKQIVIDDPYKIRAVVSQWIADDKTEVIMITGGTGFTARDTTPEAVSVLFDKQVEGFGELFRAVSYQEIGSSTIQSRALAGFANNTVIFCMPGSTGACKTAWTKIIVEQINAQHKPCNFMPHLGAK